ncbi:MAG: 50S ribosomal protein L31e [Thermoplasmatota archaeon]|nr:50S ribosomal protein L31e [Halobacteriales archaeon]
MADKTSTELERVYTIPLRKTKDLVRSRRAQLAVRDVKRFLTRHMKSEHIWLDNEVNELLWQNGKYRIPSRIRIRATRFNDGVVEVTLPDTEHAGSVRSEIKERQEKAAEKTILKAPTPEGEEGHEHAEGDDKPVTDIAGIGPATAEKLAKAEVESIADLAAADPEALAKATGYGLEKVNPWIEEAKKLAPPALKAEEKAEAPAEAPEHKAKPAEGAEPKGEAKEAKPKKDE